MPRSTALRMLILLWPLAPLAGCAQDTDDPATGDPAGAADAAASPEDPPEDSPEDTPEDSPEDTPEDSPEDTPEDSPADTPDAGSDPALPGDSAVPADLGAGDGERFAALFSDVLAPANCASAYCHHAGGDGAEGPEAFWRWLTTSVSENPECGEDRRRFVVPGEPEASLLYLKVAPGVEACGEKMPAGREPGGLSAPEAERVRAWIADGARF